MALKKNERLIISNLIIYGEESIIDRGFIVIEGEKIAEIGSVDKLNRSAYKDVPVIELAKKFKLIPGMIDLHIHGIAGADVMDGTKESIETMASTLPWEGTTSFLATTISQEENDILKALQNVSEYIDKSNVAGRAEVLGVHLEGPFISPERAGAQPLHAIIEPNVELFKKWQEAAGGQIKMVTLAPERKGGIQLIEHLKDTGVVASIGHSDALYQQVLTAIKSGISHATHLYNGMRGMHHREPGVAGAVLLHDEITAEVIVDGVHISPEMVKLTYEIKGREGLILVTDAMRAKCLGKGVYQLAGQQVFVDDTMAALDDGTLAGSILKMKDAMTNMIEFSGCSLEDVIYMTAINPAKQLGITDRKGSIYVGKDADLVVLDERNDVIMTFCRGQICFDRLEEKRH